MQPTKQYKAFTIGTATFDTTILAAKLEQLNGTKHPDPVYTYEQPGGSAINTTIGFKTVANVFDVPVIVFPCTKLGKDTEYKRQILEAVENQFYDKTLIDMAYEQDFEVPHNIIIASKIVGRDILREFQNNAHPSYKKTGTPYHRGTKDQIREAVDESDIVILHSRFPDLSLVAAIKAREKNIPVALDLSEKDPEIIARLDNMIRHCDYVLAPSDALLPGMENPDPDELFHRLVKEYGREFVAVSNSGDPVKIYDHGKDIRLPVNKVDVVDENGAGDLKIAAFSFFLLQKDDPLTAYKKATSIATHSVRYPGREWIKDLPNFVKSEPLFKSHFQNDRADQLQHEMT